MRQAIIALAPGIGAGEQDRGRPRPPKGPRRLGLSGKLLLMTIPIIALAARDPAVAATVAWIDETLARVLGPEGRRRRGEGAHEDEGVS